MTKKTDKKPKTETIKQRAVYVYLPSEEMIAEWKNHAENQNTSLSKFVIEHVTNSLNSETHQPSIETRISLIQKNKQLQTENKELHTRIKLLENLCERLEKDFRRQTSRSFQTHEFMGIRSYETDLIRIFKTCNEIRKEDIYHKLNIDPSDKEVTTAIVNQIENLIRYGLIKDIGGKWRWTR